MCEKTTKTSNCRAYELLDTVVLKLIHQTCNDIRTRNLLVQRAPLKTVLVVDDALGLTHSAMESHYLIDTPHLIP